MMPTKLPAQGDVWGWMTLPLKRYAEFQGRSCRNEFWFYSLFLFLGHLFFMVLLVLAAAAADNVDGGGASALVILVFGLWFLFFAVNFVPGLAVTARRFHDLGMPGALLIVVYIGMFILSFIAWIAYLVVMALPSQPHENRYGPPVGEDLTANVFR